MDSNAIKFIYLAVGLFISIAVITGVLISVNSYKEAFDIVETTSMGLKGEFIDLEKYNGVTLKGVDVLNTVKKYAESKYVSLVIDLATIGNLEFNAKIQTPEVYDGKIKTLRQYLNKSTTGGLSYYNKEFRFEIIGLEKVHKDELAPVVIKIREV